MPGASLVFFDFDGTIVTRDTIWPLGAFLARAKLTKRLVCFCTFLSIFALLKLRFLSNQIFKERFVALLVGGEPVERVARLVERFHDQHLQSHLNPDVVRQLLWHVERGHEVYLVSSNYDFVLRPLVQRWQLAGVIASETEVALGVFTGRLRGPACHGPEKLTRVTRLFGEARVRDALSYADDRKADVFLMQAVREAHWVPRETGTRP
jgi:phosphatidylglycerophosphatase C